MSTLDESVYEFCDKDIPSYSVVFGTSPNNTIKRITPEKFNELTGSMFSENEG